MRDAFQNIIQGGIYSDSAGVWWDLRGFLTAKADDRRRHEPRQAEPGLGITKTGRQARMVSRVFPNGATGHKFCGPSFRRPMLHGRSHRGSMAQVGKRRVLVANTKFTFLTNLFERQLSGWHRFCEPELKYRKTETTERSGGCGERSGGGATGKLSYQVRTLVLSYGNYSHY